MAEVSGNVVMLDDGTGYVLWEALGNGDNGKPVAVGRFTDKTVQVVGTFGDGGDVDMKGDNSTATFGATYGALHDPQGNAISIGDTDPLLISESPRYIAPDVAAGDGTTDLDVYVFFAVKGV